MECDRSLPFPQGGGAEAVLTPRHSAQGGPWRAWCAGHLGQVSSRDPPQGRASCLWGASRPAGLGAWPLLSRSPVRRGDSSFLFVQGGGGEEGYIHISCCPQVGRSKALQTQPESEVVTGSSEDHRGSRTSVNLGLDAGRENGVSRWTQGPGDQGGVRGGGGTTSRADCRASQLRNPAENLRAREAWLTDSSPSPSFFTLGVSPFTWPLTSHWPRWNIFQTTASMWTETSSPGSPGTADTSWNL